MVLSVSGSRVDIHRQCVQVDGAGIDANIIFFHQEYFASCAGIFLARDNLRRRYTDKQTGVVGKFHLVVLFLAVDDYGILVFSVNICRQGIGLGAVVCKIVPVFMALET